MWCNRFMEEQLQPDQEMKVDVHLIHSLNKRRNILLALLGAVILIGVVLVVTKNPVLNLLPKKQNLTISSYKLSCGNKECLISQIKPNTEISLRIDASNAFAKYTNTKPNLCYYSNIEPTQNLLKWEAVTIEGKKFMGGCIKNAYNFYQKKSQFAFFVTGKIPNQKPVVKAFITSSGEKTVEEEIKNGGIEIFNLE